MSDSGQIYIFYYPSTTVGGAQNLFLRIAKALAAKGEKIGVIDQKDGYISRSLNESKIQFEYFSIDELKSAHLSDRYLIVAPLSYISIISESPLVNSAARLLLWDLHPNNMIEQAAFSFFYKKYGLNFFTRIFLSLENRRIFRLREILKLLNEKKSLYFMCRSNFEKTKKFFSVDFSPSYIPIAGPDIKKIGYENVEKCNGKLRLGWLGRLDGEKIPILNDLIKDISKLSGKRRPEQLVLNVIGNGDSMASIIRPDNLEINFIGVLEGEGLARFVRGCVDVGFAVGTSSLEFAANAIPSVLLPNPTQLEHFKGQKKKYLPLHMAVNHEVAVESYFAIERLFELSEVLDYSEITDNAGSMGKEYVYRNHSLDAVSDIFYKNSIKSRFRCSDLKQMNRAEFFERFLIALKMKSKALLRR